MSTSSATLGSQLFSALLLINHVAVVEGGKGNYLYEVASDVRNTGWPTRIT